jgi:hypothetical protein
VVLGKIAITLHFHARETYCVQEKKRKELTEVCIMDMPIRDAAEIEMP